MTLPRVLLFDLNNTVFDVSGVPRDELRAYSELIAEPVWRPLVMSPEWEAAPAWPDAKEGIERLQAAGFRCVTLSNNPVESQVRMADRADIAFDGYVPLEDAKVYKPAPDAYTFAYIHCSGLPGLALSDCLMVTANESFGDLEQARALGMRAELIRRRPAKVEPAEGPRTIVELAEMLEREAKAK